MRFFESMQRRYGDRYRVRFLAFGETVVVCSQADVARLIAAQPGELSVSRGNLAVAPLVGDESLIVIGGDEHLQRKRIALPALHGDRLRDFAGAIEQLVNDVIDSWTAGGQVVLFDEFQTFALDAVVTLVFGERDPRWVKQIRELFNGMDPRAYFFVNIAESSPRLGALLKRPTQRFYADKRALDDLVSSEIAVRRRDPAAAAEQTDLLSMLTVATGPDGERLTDSEIHADAMSVLLAGHETTRSALAWIVEFLLRDPDALAKVVAEAAGDDHEYIDATIKEGLRLRPILPLIWRQATQPFELEGCTVPAGSQVAANIYMSQRDSAVYDNPERFDPARFLGDPPPQANWLPFGGGMRRCPGAAFALMEMRIALQTIFRRTRLSPVRGELEPTVRRAMSLVPKHGVEVVVESIDPQRTNRYG